MSDLWGYNETDVLTDTYNTYSKYNGRVINLGYYRSAEKWHVRAIGRVIKGFPEGKNV